MWNAAAHRAEIEAEIQEEFVRAAGPGGQNVNKVSSAVCLRFDVAASPTLPPAVKKRLVALAGHRMSDDGVLILKAQESRSQNQNREEARTRLFELILQACVVPKVRRPTKPTRGSQKRRLDSKNLAGKIKKNRRGPEAE